MEKKENDIIYSKALKAGKRIYYLDVKKNRRDELFLAVTESKKVVSGAENDPVIQFEKHKIFLYKEDFDKFMEGLAEVIQYIRLSTGVADLIASGQEKPLTENTEVSGTAAENVKAGG